MLASFRVLCRTLPMKYLTLANIKAVVLSCMHSAIAYSAVILQRARLGLEDTCNMLDPVTEPCEQVNDCVTKKGLRW